MIVCKRNDIVICDRQKRILFENILSETYFVENISTEKYF